MYALTRTVLRNLGIYFRDVVSLTRFALLKVQRIISVQHHL
jgi:hypothetical protein